eukprot:gene57745-biopygen93295
MFVSALVDSFQEHRRGAENLNFLTDDQQEWVNMRKVLFRHIRPPIHVDPSKKESRWRTCIIRLVARRGFEIAINTAIVLNVVVLATEHYDQPSEFGTAAEAINDVFVCFFAIEAGLKIIAYQPRGYFMSGWNRFDFFVVVSSCIGFIIKNSISGGGGDIGGVVSVFRALRLLRLIRLLQAAKGVQALLRTLFMTLPTMVNISCIMLLVFFCYAVLGVMLFGKVKHGEFLRDWATFDDFPRALLLLLRTATGEAWPGIMHDCVVSPPDCDENIGECGAGFITYCNSTTCARVGGGVY